MSFMHLNVDCFLLLKANANGIVFKKPKPDYSEFPILIKKKKKTARMYKMAKIVFPSDFPVILMPVSNLVYYGI